MQAIASLGHERYASQIGKGGSIPECDLPALLNPQRDHFELPIQYDRHRHGYFYSRPVDKFPGAPSITEAEMYALLVAHKAIAQYHGTPFHQPLQMAFQKLTGQLENRELNSVTNLGDAVSFRPFAPEDSDPRSFKTITRALADRKVLSFKYRNWGKREILNRCVHPHHVASIDNHWYMFAYEGCG